MLVLSSLGNDIRLLISREINLKGIVAMFDGLGTSNEYVTLSHPPSKY